MTNRILVSASVFHALNDATTVVVPMVFPLLYGQSRLITSYSQIGWLSNAGLFATLVAQFLIVKISVHVEYKSLMLLSMLGICLSLACVPLASSFLSLLLFFVFMRAVTGFYHPVMIAWIARSQPVRSLDQAMGVQSGSGNMGVLLAFLSVGYLAQKWNWKTPLAAWSVFGLVLGSLGVMAIRSVSSKTDARPSLHVSSWLRILSQVRTLIPGFVFGGFGWTVVVFYAPSLLNHQFDVPMGRTGLYLSLWIALGTVSGYAYGFLSRCLGRRVVFLMSIGMGALSLTAMGLAPGRTMAVAGLLAFGIFLLITYPSLHTLVGSSVPHGDKTQAFSWVANVQMVAGAAVALAAGFLSDRFGIRAPFVLSAALAGACFLFYVFARFPEPGAAESL